MLFPKGYKMLLEEGLDYAFDSFMTFLQYCICRGEIYSFCLQVGQENAKLALSLVGYAEEVKVY